MGSGKRPNVFILGLTGSIGNFHVSLESQAVPLLVFDA